ncbi:MAG: cyclic nucleotide-binding domain-containing protein [Bauldia sp.]|uniref:cyclic nucleotide-binding domain-containing protein n=1 Tax=Bauldia sp. TaxID=2575872 RepID=UPI001D33762F|nr:cyclic nucleotide-binding domain-containing protein [Bauldia sp.]MCB1496434.1 cyclic nucleotide-binding domain-containing protein [Bauldia sp.]
MDIRGILNSTAFFNVVLDAGQLDALAAAAREVRFGRGEVIMRQGEMGAVMYALTDGKVVVSVHEPGGERVVATLAPGEVFGEMAVITGDRRSATVKAKGKATAIEIGKEALAPLLAAEPKLAERFGAVIEQRSSELASRNKEARHWVSVGVGREQIAARMTSFYSG